MWVKGVWLERVWLVGEVGLKRVGGAWEGVWPVRGGASGGGVAGVGQGGCGPVVVWEGGGAYESRQSFLEGGWGRGGEEPEGVEHLAWAESECGCGHDGAKGGVV